MIHLEKYNNKDDNFIYVTFTELMEDKTQGILLTFKSDSNPQEEFYITLGNNLSSNRRLDKYLLNIVDNLNDEDKENYKLYLPFKGMYGYVATNIDSNTLIEEGRALYQTYEGFSVYN